MHGSGGVGGGVGGVVSNPNTNLSSSGGRLHMSDMGLHITGMTDPTGYHVAQNPSGYGPQQGSTRRLSMNEMYQVSMDGRGMMPQKGNRLSSSGGIPVQPGQPVQRVQQVQPVQPPTVPPGALQYNPQHQVPQGGHPHPQPRPQMVLPTNSVAVNVPPTSSIMITTPSTGPSSYYPPTASAQEARYPVPSGVTSTPQQQPYPVPSTAGGSGQCYGGQGNFPSGPISGPAVLPKPAPQVATSSGPVVKGNPVPYAMSKGAQPIITHHTAQTGSAGGRGGVGKGGAVVLSKVRASPMRQASLSRSGGRGGGSRPREVATSQAPVSALYDQLPQQRPTASQTPSQQYPVSYPLPQSSAAAMMVAPPSTKYTNVQLHQQYQRQYLQVQQQGSSTTPYQSQSSSTRPHYQEHAQYQKQQQHHHQAPPPVARKPPPKVANKSPPKYNQTLVSTHMNGSPHDQVAPTQSRDQLLSKPQSQLQPQRQHYQQPNNITQSQGYVSTGKSLPRDVMCVNNTSLNEGRHNLVPRPNQGAQFQSHSTQDYDTLPSRNDSLSNINLDALDMNGSIASVTDELDRFTEEMSRALEQFDSLLQPQSSKPLTQTSM